MIFTIRHNGNVYTAKNKILKEGLQLLRDGSSDLSVMLCFPIQGTLVNFLDTLTIHPDWDVIPDSNYSGLNNLVFADLPVGNLVTSSPISWTIDTPFTLNGLMCYWGAPYFSDRTGKFVHIFSAAILAQPIELKAQDELVITYTISGAHNVIT